MISDSTEPPAGILIVDDQPANLLALEAVLGDLGHQLVRAASGEDALRSMADRDFAVVLLDVRMHGMDGFQTARHARTRERSRYTPIIFMTAEDESQASLEEAYSLGAVDYLVKPLVPAILRAKVAAFMDLFRQKLRAEREADQLKLLIHGTTDHAIFMLDPAGRVATWNVGAERIKGYAAGEIIGQHFSRFYPKDSLDRGWPFEELRRAEAGGRFEDEGWRVRKDGTQFWANVVITALRDRTGGLRGFSKVTRDLSERRRREEELHQLHRDLEKRVEDRTAALFATTEALRESEARKAAILATALDGILTIDHDGTVIEFNPAAEAMFGYLRGEVIGREMAEFIIPPTFRDAHRRGMARYLETGEGPVLRQRIELTALRADGSEFPVELAITPIPGGDRPVFTGFVRDITQRKATETALRASEEQFRTLADSIPQLAWTARPDGHSYWYNRRWYEYTGTTPDEMVGWGWQSVHDPVELPAVLERWKGSIATGESFEMVFPLKGEGGVFRPFLTRVVPVRGDDGHVLRWFGTNTDISAIKAMEDKLREADRRKDEFLATLAHELRNPLAPIRNGLQVIRLAGASGTVEQARVMMDRQLTQMVRLVDDLLDVSRITRGKIELRTERLEIRAVIDAAVETSRPAIEQAGHELTLKVPDGPIFVNGDAARLAQVVSNLLNNSAKYTYRGGHVRLTVMRDGGEVTVSVADDGIGIPTAMLGKVFEMFTQVDRTLEKTTGGLGIGLSLVKGLVDMHGGTIVARSEGEGRGSEFVVRLPVATPVAGRPDATNGPVEAVGASGRRRILVVDDNEDAADSLAQLLELLGNEVQTANDGEAGVGAAAKFRPDVVLMDIGMPRLNGYEAASRIREQAWGTKMVLIALTGWGQEDDRRKSQEVGFDCHLVKPVEYAALMKLLAEVPNAGASSHPPGAGRGENGTARGE